MSDNAETKITRWSVRTTREGTTECAYVSGNGQLVIDQHASDDEHLKAPATRGSQPLYDCRLYWSEVFPKEWLGRPGEFTVRTARIASGDAVEVVVTFSPATEDA